MRYEIVQLDGHHLDVLLKNSTLDTSELRRAYFSPGSSACCLLADGVPSFAGGIVNLDWGRGEAWILATPFFLSHVKTCIKALRDYLPQMAQKGKFRRVQAMCIEGTKASIIRLLGFTFEGVLQKYGPNGEPCRMYSRIFEVQP